MCQTLKHGSSQDLQRLIKAADQLTETGSSNKKKKSAANKKKEEETRSWRIQDKPLNAGVSLRSAKTKQGLQVCISFTEMIHVGTDDTYWYR